MIGGNITLQLQVKSTKGKNLIGEDVTSWVDSKILLGFLDLSGGDSKHTVYAAKIQESTHIFVCDYVDLAGITAENSRAICNEQIYEVLLIDNPMELNKHIEIYLKFIGGQNG